MLVEIIEKNNRKIFKLVQSPERWKSYFCLEKFPFLKSEVTTTMKYVICLASGNHFDFFDPRNGRAGNFMPIHTDTNYSKW